MDCYGPYTAKDGVCKFNGTVTSQCPSGSGVPKAYHAKNAYAVGQTVNTLLKIIYFISCMVNCLFIQLHQHHHH